MKLRLSALALGTTLLVANLKNNCVYTHIFKLIKHICKLFFLRFCT